MSGNLWKVSDQLDDGDILMMQKEFVTLAEGADYYGYGLNTFTKVARKAGAVYKVEKRVLVRRDIFEDYLRRTRTKG